MNNLSDKELADKVVALGVGLIGNLSEGYFISNYGIPLGGCSASQFVTDWRVAGTLMEKCKRLECRVSSFDSDLWNVHIYIGIEKQGDAWNAKSLPYAIISACVEVLSDD